MKNNLGFRIENDCEEEKYKLICTCGYTEDSCGRYTSSCRACGSNNIKYVRSGQEKVINSFIEYEIIYAAAYGFKIKKIVNRYAYIRKTDTIKSVPNLESFLTFDYKNKIFESQNSKGEVSPLTIDKIKAFLSGIEDRKLIEILGEYSKELKTFLSAIREEYGNQKGYWCRRSLAKALARVEGKFEYLQILAAVGFKEGFLKSVCGDYKYGLCGSIDTEATKPHRILKVEKYLIPYIKNFRQWNKTEMDALNDLHNTLGADAVKYLFSQIQLEGDNNIERFLGSSHEYYLELIRDYKYNFKQLATYVFRTVKIQQGIENASTALMLLKDVNKLYFLLNQKNDDKYPRSLKLVHDVLTYNYNMQKDEIVSQAFERIKKKWSKFQYDDKEYSIIFPETPSDVISEGKNLSHCVGSYVKDIIDDKCVILFARLKEEVEESLLTIEVRGSKIMQVRGNCNRNATTKEKEFIKDWAEEKNLLYAC